LLRGVWFCILLLGFSLQAAEVIPPKPTRYCNDYASVLSIPTAQSLDRTLEQLEKTDSTQILVAIYPKMQTDSSIEDYTVRTFKQWGVGQAKTNNGAVLFIFVQEHKLRIEVGYGLEGALPDITCKRIIENEITPRLRRNDWDGAVSAGVTAIIQAAHGEYKGAGRTVQGTRRGRRSNSGVVFLIFLAFVIFASTRRRRGTAYGRAGRSVWGGPFWGGGWGGGGGSWGGGSRSGGGGGWSGGFSGGGGSSGGGGASGSW
jgi:uncharacterized protein